MPDNEDEINMPKIQAKFNVWVVAFLLTGLLAFIFLFTNLDDRIMGKDIGKDKSMSKLADFLQQNLAVQQADVNIEDSALEHGVYHLTLTVNGEKQHAFMSADGFFLFPSIIDMSKPVKIVARNDSVPAVDIQ